MKWPPQIPTGPKAWTEFMAALVEKINANKPVDGLGIKTDEGKSGISINAQGVAGTAAAIAASTSPVIVKKFGDVWKAGVVPEYFLQQPIVPASTPVELTVTGKLASLEAEDLGWMPTFENDYVWIEGTVTSVVADSAYVQSYGVSGSEGGGTIENNGVAPPSTSQSKFRIFLGQVIASGDQLAFRPSAGKAHQLGIIFGFSADSGGGNQTTITGLIGYGM